jgi:hypothetical protein
MPNLRFSNGVNGHSELHYKTASLYRALASSSALQAEHTNSNQYFIPSTKQTNHRLATTRTLSPTSSPSPLPTYAIFA